MGEARPPAFVLPGGQVAAGLVMAGHHHDDEAPLVTRQHAIITACLVAAGVALGAARVHAGLAPLAAAWPWLIAVLAYLYVTYTEREPGHGGHGAPA